MREKERNKLFFFTETVNYCYAAVETNCETLTEQGAGKIFEIYTKPLHLVI